MNGAPTPLNRFRVDPGERVDLTAYDTAWTGTPEMAELSEKKLQKHAKKILKERRKALAHYQELLYADNRHSLLLIFQGMDAAGKDGTIKHVMRGVNPQGCQVFSFKVPSAEELDHNFLWRHWKACPERGRIGIFNRSYYEDVLVVRVHPSILATQSIPNLPEGDRVWADRFEDINAFERHLVRNGTVILKFFLHLSKEEQKNRFLDRLQEPDKHWKFSPSDLGERRHWDAYQHAFAEALSHTSTEWAPWYVMPADHKWVMRYLVSEIVVEALTGLNLATPEPTEEKRALIGQALETLGG
ncbi:MAG: polyphosphate kinase 2 family protein [Pseudomonadota bacterium]